MISLISIYFDDKNKSPIFNNEKDKLIYDENLYNYRFYTTTLIYLLGSLGIALVLDDLGIILSLIGATGSTVVTFILPGAAYYIMHRDTGPTWKRYGAIILFTLGCIIMPMCLTFIFV